MWLVNEESEALSSSLFKKFLMIPDSNSIRYVWISVKMQLNNTSIVLLPIYTLSHMSVFSNITLKVNSNQRANQVFTRQLSDILTNGLVLF